MLLRFAAFLVIAPFAMRAAQLTARQVIEQVKIHTGVPWSGPTVDTFKAGNPDEPVTGIATTFSATYDVLQRASAQGKNFIIAHEPTFYGHQDTTDWLSNDPVYQQKLAFIQSHHMVVFRFHDHWHAMKPDGILHGMVTAFGWEKYQDAAQPHLFTLPETTLRSLAADLASRLKIQRVRVVGDRNLKVSKIALLPGAAGEQPQVHLLQQDNVEVLIVGESREWETVPYAQDAAAEGRKKALILLGHVPSEEEGMRYCAEWLKTFLPGTPVEFIPGGEPFWGPTGN